MSTIGKQSAGGDEFIRLKARVGMTKHRQAKRRLGDENIARHRLKRYAG